MPPKPKPYYRPGVERSIDFSSFLSKYSKHNELYAEEEWDFTEERVPDDGSWIDDEDV